MQEALMVFSTIRRPAVLGAMLVALSGAANAARGQEHGHQEAAVAHHHFAIPEPIQAEHKEIHAELVAATKVPGPVGEAAQALAKVLDPHFVREEQIALPPLALLGPLSRGDTSPEMRGILPMTDSLRAELPRMLGEHKVIHAATAHLEEVARKHGNEAVAHLAQKLTLHARGEEEVYYPAAILVGELVRRRLGDPLH
jgi:hypothetical protein